MRALERNLIIPIFKRKLLNLLIVTGPESVSKASFIKISSPQTSLRGFRDGERHIPTWCAPGAGRGSTGVPRCASRTHVVEAIAEELRVFTCLVKAVLPERQPSEGDQRADRPYTSCHTFLCSPSCLSEFEKSTRDGLVGGRCEGTRPLQ